MATSLHRKAKWGFVLLGALLALTLGLISGPASVQASTTNYCGGWKGPGQECNGAARQVYQVGGWGDQASVCVGIGGWTGVACSSGAGVGVFTSPLPSNVYSWLYLKNNSGINNHTTGVAFTK